MKSDENCGSLSSTRLTQDRRPHKTIQVISSNTRPKTGTESAQRYPGGTRLPGPGAGHGASGASGANESNSSLRAKVDTVDTTQVTHSYTMLHLLLYTTESERRPKKAIHAIHSKF